MATTTTTPLFVAKIKGTVKGERSATLGPRTLIIGPNGAGKTATLNTLELALSGHATDVGTREALREASSLIALAPLGEPLHAVAVLNDGRSAAFRIDRAAGGKIKRPAHAPIDNLTVVYPWTEAEGALRTTEKAQAFLLRHGGEAVTVDAVLAQLPHTSRKLGADVLASLSARNPDLPVLDLLPLAADQIKARVRALRGEIKGAAAVLSQLAADGAAPALGAPNPAVLADLDAAWERAEAQVRATVFPRPPEAPAAPTGPTRDDALRLYQQAQAVYQRQQEAVARLTAAREAETALAAQAPPRPVQGGDVAVLSGLLSVLDAYLAHGQGRSFPCPVCTGVLTVDGTIAARREAAWTRREVLATAHTAAESAWAEATAELSRVRAEVQAAVAFSEELGAQVQAAVAAYQRVYTALSAVPAEDPEARRVYDDALVAYQAECQRVEGELSQLRAAQEEINAQRRAHYRAADTWNNAAKARDTVAGLEAEERDLGVLLDHLAEVRRILVTDLRTAFCARVQRYLPEVHTFGVDPVNGCDFGLVRGEALHTALSGAERNMLIFALSAVVAEDAGPHSLAVLFTEERAYDGVMLAATMRALSAVRGQVLITSPVRPRGKLPAGWTICDLSGADAADAAETVAAETVADAG